MKITKRQLKRIIREEKQKILESFDDDQYGYGPQVEESELDLAPESDEYRAEVDVLDAALRKAIRVAVQSGIPIEEVEYSCEKTIQEFYYGGR